MTTTAPETETEPTVELPADEAVEPTEPTPDVAPQPAKKRATTAAGRKAEAAANRARRAQAKAAGKKDTKPRATAARKSPLDSRINASLIGLGSAVTIGGSIIGSEPLTADGQVIVQNAPNIADALSTLAKNDPRVAEALERLLSAGAYGGLITALMPVAIGIMANHGMIPAGLAQAMGIATVAPQAQPAPAGDPLKGAWG